jgi:hypothetical protein
MVVSGLLQYYLKSLKVCEDAKPVQGILLWSVEARNGSDDYHGKGSYINDVRFLHVKLKCHGPCNPSKWEAGF